MRGPGCRCQQRARPGVPHLRTFDCMVCGLPVDRSGLLPFVCPQYRPDANGECLTCDEPLDGHTQAARALERCPDEAEEPMAAANPHVLGEEECLVAHLDGDPRSCRRCLTCGAWLRPSQWDAACPGVA